MTLRAFVRELRDFPATSTFCALWIVVFVAMVATQGVSGAAPSWAKLLFSGIGDGHRFGDLALADMARGQYWRLVTSTFIHFSVIHLVLNLMAIYQLGTMVESWYGSPQFVFLYVATGGGGNLVSVVIRYWLGSNPHVHSGGGSVVIMGLVGLCAVAGLRSQTKMGLSLGKIMVFFIVVTAVIGYFFAEFIDNWGHAGGALVGFGLGFFHRKFLSAMSKPSAWGRGVLSAVMIGACCAAQAIDDRRDAPARAEQSLVRRLAVLERNYRVLGESDSLARKPKGGELIARVIDDLLVEADGRPLDAGEIRRLRAMAGAAAKHPLSAGEASELRKRLSGLLEKTRRDYAANRKKLWELRHDSRSQGLR
jgi:rhomboid protease GluP